MARSDKGRRKGVSMTGGIDFVIDRFNTMLVEDGAQLAVLGCEDGVLELRYETGSSTRCETCVLDPDDLEDLVAEALEAQGAAVTAVRVVRR